VRYEDKQKIINNIQLNKDSDVRTSEHLKITSIDLNPDTLLYSWGCARDGKLGISDNYATEFDQDLLPRFYLDDKIERNNDDLENFMAR
jgi:hypothetical protein